MYMMIVCTYVRCLDVISFEIFIRHEIHTTCNSYERPNLYELHVVRFSCSKVHFLYRYLLIIKFYYIPGKAVTLLKFGTWLSLHAQSDNLLSCPKVLCHAALYNIYFHGLHFSSKFIHFLRIKFIHFLRIMFYEQLMCNICNPYFNS